MFAGDAYPTREDVLGCISVASLGTMCCFDISTAKTLKFDGVTIFATMPPHHL